jgi:hypothetical protein
MTTWIVRNLAMLILNMALNFMFVCNPKTLQMWQSKLSTYSWFHLYIGSKWQNLDNYYIIYVYSRAYSQLGYPRGQSNEKRTTKDYFGFLLHL